MNPAITTIANNVNRIETMLSFVFDLILNSIIFDLKTLDELADPPNVKFGLPSRTVSG